MFIYMGPITSQGIPGLARAASVTSSTSSRASEWGRAASTLPCARRARGRRAWGRCRRGDGGRRGAVEGVTCILFSIQIPPESLHRGGALAVHLLHPLRPELPRQDRVGRRTDSLRLKIRPVYVELTQKRIWCQPSATRPRKSATATPATKSCSRARGLCAAACAWADLQIHPPPGDGGEGLRQG